MQTALCPHCKENGIVTRCSKDHLEKHHRLSIIPTRDLIKQISDLNSSKEEKTGDKKESTKRQIKLKFADLLVSKNIDNLRNFLVKTS